MQILKVGKSEKEESFMEKMEKYPSEASSGLEVEARGIPARFGVDSPRHKGSLWY